MTEDEWDHQEPSFSWKESVWCFSCKLWIYHALRIWAEKISHEGQFCVLHIPIVHRSCRDSTILTTDLTIAHEVTRNLIGVRLRKTGFNGSTPCRTSEFSNKAGADNDFNRGYQTSLPLYMHAVVLSFFLRKSLVRRLLGIFIKDPWDLSCATQKQDKWRVIDGKS